MQLAAVFNLYNNDLIFIRFKRPLAAKPQMNLKFFSQCIVFQKDSDKFLLGSRALEAKLPLLNNFKTPGHTGAKSAY